MIPWVVIFLITCFIVMASYAMTKYYSRTKRDKYLQKFVHAYEKGLVIYDTESTGLCVEDDDIIEIAAVVVKVGTIIGKFDIMLKKHEGKNIPQYLGDIENPMVKAYADSRNKKYGRREGLEMFLEFINKRPLLAHNVIFDYNILDNNLKRDTMTHTFKDDHPEFFDSRILAKYLFPLQKIL